MSSVNSHIISNNVRKHRRITGAIEANLANEYFQWSYVPVICSVLRQLPGILQVFHTKEIQDVALRDCHRGFREV